MKIDRKFMGRLATYLIGVAIGLGLLGLIQLRKSKQQAPPNALSQPDQRVPMSGSEGPTPATASPD